MIDPLIRSLEERFAISTRNDMSSLAAFAEEASLPLSWKKGTSEQRSGSRDLPIYEMAH